MSEVVKSLLPTLATMTDAEKDELRAWLDHWPISEDEFDELTPEQVAEIDRRIDAIDPNDPGIPAEDVFRRLDERRAERLKKAAG